MCKSKSIPTSAGRPLASDRQRPLRAPLSARPPSVEARIRLLLISANESVSAHPSLGPDAAVRRTKFRAVGAARRPGSKKLPPKFSLLKKLS